MTVGLCIGPGLPLLILWLLCMEAGLRTGTELGDALPTLPPALPACIGEAFG